MLKIRLHLALIIYLLLIGILIYVNPKIFYNKDRKLKIFGVGTNKTIFPLWMIILLFAFISYYFSSLILYVANY
jgi:hypothetical protein